MNTASYCEQILFLKDGKLIYELQKGARTQEDFKQYPYVVREEEIKEYVKDFRRDFIY